MGRRRLIYNSHLRRTYVLVIKNKWSRLTPIITIAFMCNRRVFAGLEDLDAVFFD